MLFRKWTSLIAIVMCLMSSACSGVITLAESFIDIDGVNIQISLTQGFSVASKGENDSASSDDFSCPNEANCDHCYSCHGSTLTKGYFHFVCSLSCDMPFPFVVDIFKPIYRTPETPPPTVYIIA